MPGYQEMFLPNLKFKMNNFSGSGFSVIHLHGVEGAHDFFGNSANTDSRGNLGKPRYPWSLKF